MLLAQKKKDEKGSSLGWLAKSLRNGEQGRAWQWGESHSSWEIYLPYGSHISEYSEVKSDNYRRNKRISPSLCTKFSNSKKKDKSLSLDLRCCRGVGSALLSTKCIHYSLMRSEARRWNVKMSRPCQSGRSNISALWDMAISQHEITAMIMSNLVGNNDDAWSVAFTDMAISQHEITAMILSNMVGDNDEAWSAAFTLWCELLIIVCFLADWNCPVAILCWWLSGRIR